MKKLLIIPALLAVVLFSFYPKQVKKETTNTSPIIIKTVTAQTLAQEVETYYQAKKETKITEKKPFKVTLKSDINTTRNHLLSVNANIENSDDPTACNLFWYEEGELINVGAILEREFDKGEHFITVKAKNSQGEESNDTMMITAWDYKKLVRLNYNPYSEMFDPRGYSVYDYKNRLVLREGYGYTYMIRFNEENQKEEVINKNKNHPQWDNIKRYTYTENGEIDSIKTLTLEEEVIHFEKNFFDEEGNLTKTLMGKDEDSLIDYSLEQEVYYEGNDQVYYDSTIYNDTSKVIRNEENLTTYEEYDYGYVKEITKYEYDDNKTIRKIERTSRYQNDEEEVGITLYDEKGDELKSEKIYKNGEEILCHYSSVSTYNDNYQTLTSSNKVLDGECGYLDIYNSFKSFTYDEDGRTLEIKEAETKGAENIQTSYRMLKFYTNTLEGDEQ